jgi:hypothetical protein
MASPKKPEQVTLHLKTERMVRDRLLGTLRARGTTMQQFFDSLMRALIEHPEYIEEIEQWADDDKEPALDAA